ncbi:MAG TPA: AsmA-like C-terminal region-containing protein [Bacteroidales bacterium]|nr:AsmA-like C-terminal region-containing protein [Bacteroidales bacterium]
MRKFPKASLELKDVLVHSSSNFNSESFAGAYTDTLLSARFVSVEFKITDIINGIYNIESIRARAGKINFFIDTTGDVNYDISAKTKTPGKEDFTINLERINLSDIKASYNNLATRLTINGIVKNGRLKSRISGKNIDFTAGAEVLIDSLQLYNTKIINPIITELDINLQSSKDGIRFKKGTLQIENFDFGLDGSISSDNILDLNITGNNLDISNISKYLPEKYLSLISEYDPSGILLVECKIQGQLTRTSNPHIEIKTLLNKGHIAYGKSDLSVNDLSFIGYFTNGSKNKPESSYFSIKDIKAKLGSAEYSGSFLLSGFDNPMGEFLLKGKVFPEELIKFFDLQNISTASGFFDFDLKLLSNLKHKEKFTLSDIIDMKPEVTLRFNSFSIGLNSDKLLFNNVNGNVLVSNTIRADSLLLTYKGQHIRIDGEFINLPEWLIGRPVQMTTHGDVSFSKFIPEAFFKNASSSGTTTTNRPAFTLPDDIILDINFKIDSLKYKSFSSSKFEGSLKYKPRLLTFNSLNMQSLSGMISGNGFVVQNSSKSVIARGNFNVKSIDVNKAFSTFNNFGQDFLKAENLAGKLSGSLSLLLPTDSMLNPQIKAITAEGKFTLVNGALINFDPVKQLSNFIELSELENINFEKLENDFFIKNNFLYVPQMEVKSSAADLLVNGKHSFGNDYEYHIKMLLSEILSKKRKKNRNTVSEFGVVQDDGLGRTSLLLKIENKGDDVKVGYDIKAAGSEIKNNINSERQTLKTILNQEYGWFKADTTIKQKPTEKSRFKIIWDEADSVKATPDTIAGKKEGVLKNLFKKK